MKNKKPDVLVLNKSYCPLHIISWQKAMSLICQDAARAMDRDFISYSFEDWTEYSNRANDYPYINTSRYKINIPEIIVLRKYDRLPARDVKYSRQTLFERDDHICGYCGKRFKKDELTIDHIIPRAKGGGTTWKNTVTCCISCNRKKADKNLAEVGMKLLIKPSKPGWFSPVAKVKPDHPCKSWLHFATRISAD